jgi:penicillin-binding protein 1B
MATRTSKRSKRSRRRRSGWPWGRLLSSLGVLAIMLAAIYAATLAKTVRVRFEGQKWALPARVYARPLELYSGSTVTRAQLLDELQRLGYHKVAAADSTGSWSENQGWITLESRPFSFWDGAEPARHLRIRIDGKGVKEIRDARTNGHLAIVRLEPLEIGSIHPIHAEDRVLVRGDEVPAMLQRALLAVEDQQFYTHFGVSPKSIMRAVIANVRAGRTVQGGSTLTQQLVKNFFLTPERSLKRKLEEAAMALVVEAHYSKDEILNAYINEIFLGQDGDRAIHGFGLASYFYFNMPLAELDLPRIALLVGMIKGPSYYNPRRNPERALERRNLVLSMLEQEGVVSAAEAHAARQQPLGVTATGRRGRSAYPAFLDLVRRQLHRDYREQDLVSDGLRIFTTLNPWAQHQAEQALANRLAALEKNYRIDNGVLQGAIVIVNSQDGEVLAIVGGREADFAGFNRALDALRPIGSLVKPAVYLTALQEPQRFALSTLIDDVAVSIRGDDGKVWSPKNYDKKEHGRVSLQLALAKSYNLATVRLGQQVGVERVVQTLRALGITQRIDPYPSLFLGSLSLSPLEVAQMYQTLASGGFRSPLRSIREVLNTEGRPPQRYPLTVQTASPAAPAYLVNKAMQNVVEIGTARYLNTLFSADLGLAGKTGTTDNLRDSWFAGFSSDLVAVVWVGRDDNQPARLSGSSGALRVWGDLMKNLNPQSLQLMPPDSIETRRIDPATGLLADAACTNAADMPFVRGYGPERHAPCSANASRVVATPTLRSPRSPPERRGGGMRDADGHPDFGEDGAGQANSGGDDPISKFLRRIFQ